MGTRQATGEVNLRMRAIIQNFLADGTSSASVVGGQLIRDTLESGIEELQFNRAWSKSDINISDGNFADFNLSDMTGLDIGAGAGNDALGQDMDIEEIVFLAVYNPNGPGILEVQATVPGAAAIAWLPAGYASNANGGGIAQNGLRFWYEPGAAGLDIDPATSAVLRLSAAAGQGNITGAQIYVLGRHDDDESSSSSLSSQSSTSLSSTSSSTP